VGHENRIIVIDPSSYQHRKYFDEERLRELGAIIVQDGLKRPLKSLMWRWAKIPGT